MQNYTTYTLCMILQNIGQVFSVQTDLFSNVLTRSLDSSFLIEACVKKGAAKAYGIKSIAKT